MRLRSIKVDINVLMAVLLIGFVTSFALMIICGEIWRINFLMTDSRIESLDPAKIQAAFIASCVAIATGASMLYISETRFSQEEGQVKPERM